MAGRKRNALALAVMGLLQERPMHPYEIARTIRERGQDTSVKLTTGSLYDTIAALARDGWIEPTQTGREGSRPERTVYRQTDQGQRNFVSWLDAVISDPAPEFPAFLSAIAYLGALGREGAIASLKTRLDRLDVRIDELTAALIEATTVQGAPRLFVIEGEYALAMLDAERQWSRRIVDQVVTGELAWPEPVAAMPVPAAKRSVPDAKRSVPASAGDPGRGVDGAAKTDEK